ncbi:hypothetical protein [Martelella sp. AMO21009]
MSKDDEWENLDYKNGTQIVGALLNLQIAVGRLLATHPDREAILEDMEEHVGILAEDLEAHRAAGRADMAKLFHDLHAGAQENYHDLIGTVGMHEPDH